MKRDRYAITVSSRIITPIIKMVLSLICRIDARELRRVPMKGPLIIILNHVNFLEPPLLYSYLFPRKVIGVAKRETWNNPLFAAIADSWHAISLDRDGTDMTAMRNMLEALDNGAILVLAPEGTRSKDGRLRKGHGGVVQIALRSGAPILPVACLGGERFWMKFKAVRRTGFSFKVGEAFKLVAPGGEAGVSKGERRELTDSMMNRLSLLLPTAMRGEYPEPESASMRYIEMVGRNR